MTDAALLQPELTHAPAPRKRIGVRPTTMLATLVAITAFLFIAEGVILAGYARQDIAALIDGEAWRRGGWLSQIVLGTIKILPWQAAWPSVAALLAAAVMGLLFGVIYRRLRANGWYTIGTWLALVALGGNAMVLYSTSAGSRGIPYFVAVGALIPAIRLLENVGDVQAAISLGLLLPLLLLASPVLAPLILPLAIAAALADRDGRRDLRAFVAMLLVSVLPSLIVAAGIIGFGVQAGLSMDAMITPYVTAFTPSPNPGNTASLVALAYLAPVGLVPLAACVLPGRDNHVWSSLAVVALPLYLALCQVFFEVAHPTWLPAATLLAAFISWLAVVRLSFGMRVAALILLFVSAVMSWRNNPFIGDQAWIDALGTVAGTVARTLHLPV